MIKAMNICFIGILITSMFVLSCQKKEEKQVKKEKFEFKEYTPSEHELSILKRLKNKYGEYEHNVQGGLYAAKGVGVFFDANGFAHVSISKMPIDSLPEELYELKKIKSISLTKTKFKKIPHLSKFRSLKWIRISYSEIEGTLVLNNDISNLEKLGINDSKVTNLVITCKTNLVGINIYNTDIEKIVYDKDTFAYLVDLGLHSNKIKTINFDNMPALKYVGLGDNPVMQDSLLLKEKYKNIHFIF